MTNLVNDVSILTNVTENTLEKLVTVCRLCIEHAVYESMCKQQEITEIDLGFGELHIKVDATGIKYKFIPSKELETTLVQTVTKHTSPIVLKLENNLQEKIDKTYKELL